MTDKPLHEMKISGILENKSFEDDDLRMSAFEAEEALKEWAIAILKEMKPSVYCKCGKKFVPWYEGETICPVMDELYSQDGNINDKINENKNHNEGNLRIIAIFDFIMDKFEIKEDELNG